MAEIGTVDLGRQRSPENHQGPHMRPYLRAANVTWNGVDVSDVLSMNFDEADFERYALTSGDVLINEGSGSAAEVGKPAIWRGEIEGCCFQNTLLRVRPTACTSEYVHRYLLHAAKSRRFVPSTQGVNIFHIGKAGLARFPIPVPPLPEQRRIVAKLDRLSARSAAARRHLARVAALAARAKQAILAAAFNGDLTADWREANALGPVVATTDLIDGRARDLEPLPDGWAWTAVGALAVVSGGLTKNPKRAEMMLRAPYLRVANVYANELRLGDVAEIGCTRAEIDHATLVAGDLLVVEGNGSLDQIGRVALWRGGIEGCLHQNHIIRVRPGANMLPEFGLFWLLSPGGRIAIEAVASSSSGLHTLSISKVKGLPIPAVPLPEQREIVRRIEAAFARIDRLADESARAARLVDRLDERLLAKAFRGELVPQDAADEPAAALLARLRQTRATVPKRGPGRPRKGAA
jgi:type I restriction enzyme S subunit